MFSSKWRLAVFLLSAVIALYGVAAAFYGKVVAPDDAYKEIAVFMDALKKITDDYVEAPDMTKVQEGALRGLMEALDPNSTYLPKSLVESLEKRKSNGSMGPGLVLSKRSDVPYVVATQRDGVADSAGVRPGDYVIAVGGTGVEDKSVVEIESMLRGEVGSKVKLTVFRGARTKPVEVELTLKPDTVVPVVTQMLDGNIGLIDISSLAGQAAAQARTKLRTLVSAGAQRLILDLRDCADGQVADAAELANFFVSSGVIYYARNRRGERVQEVQAAADKFITDLPLVVLINGSTAGPAEIVAGAIKDHKRGTIIGERSFGSGSLQTRIPLKSGGALILSTAKLYTPAGKKIQEDESLRTTGIRPDIEAPDSERHQDLLVEAYYDGQEEEAKYRQLREKIDREQLDKAVEIVGRAEVLRKVA